MNPKERLFVALILCLIGLLATADLINDWREGVVWWHISIEALIAVGALALTLFFLFGWFTLKMNLAQEQQRAADWKIEATKWREKSRVYIEGLSHEIESQLENWGLTPAEKEVSFLLLKGLSLNDIAEARKTSAKTARQQAISVYAKAGLSGRSELAAFFLEDLFSPQVRQPSRG